MNLNSDIIFDELSQFNIERHGTKQSDLLLRYPEFYRGEGTVFKANQIYLSLADQLPVDPDFESGVVIICIGGRPPSAYLFGKCEIAIIKDDVDLFKVFNSVKQVFDKYNEWDSGLQDILNTTASVKDIVERSYSIFENPLIVIDANFHHLAYSSVIETREDLSMYSPDETGSINLNLMGDVINYDWTDIVADKALILKVEEKEHICFNLSDNNRYIGNLTIPCVLRKYRESDFVLAQFIANVIMAALKKHVEISNESTIMVRSIIKDIVKGDSINSQKQEFAKAIPAGKYLCLKLELGSSVIKKVPIGYICNSIEGLLDNCVAFEYGEEIVAVVDVRASNRIEHKLNEVLADFLSRMHLRAGVSHAYTDILLTRYHYRQAHIAFEMGLMIDPEKNCYLFSDYILNYMVYNSSGEFQDELLCPSGLKRILEHDKASDTNYLDTLRLFLDNNMRMTKTAEELFVHRSTLVERLKRIERLLELDLEDSDQRLRLLISIKILDLNNKITATNTEKASLNHFHMK